MRVLHINGLTVRVDDEVADALLGLVVALGPLRHREAATFPGWLDGEQAELTVVLDGQTTLVVRTTQETGPGTLPRSTEAAARLHAATARAIDMVSFVPYDGVDTSPQRRPRLRTTALSHDGTGPRRD